MTSDSLTLSQHLTNGWMPVPEVLRHALKLGAALRHIHEPGHVHGALTPELVILTGTGLRLLPADPSVAKTVTAYSAPEQVNGRTADARTDVFAFGAVVYEMVTGMRPFSGDTPEALAESIIHHAPAPIGHAGLDRLVATCMFKNPAARWQSMQQVLSELGSLSSSDAAPRGSTRPSKNNSRGNAGVQPQAKTVEAHPEELSALRTKVEEMDRRLAETHVLAACAEQTAEEARRGIAGLQTTPAGIRELHRKVEAQTLALESARIGMERTDALVEQVVDALGSLQTLVLDAIGVPHLPNGRVAATIPVRTIGSGRA